MVDTDRATLIVIDVQEKLFKKMPEQGTLLKNMRQMIQGARVLALPILWSEQYPDGLGKTIPLIAELADNIQGHTICPLGEAAALPARSFVSKFAGEFRAHVEQKGCPLKKAAVTA